MPRQGENEKRERVGEKAPWLLSLALIAFSRPGHIFLSFAGSCLRQPRESRVCVSAKRRWEEKRRREGVREGCPIERAPERGQRTCGAREVSCMVTVDEQLVSGG